MRFLILSNPKHITPPEMIPSLVDAMSAWVDLHTASDKLEFAWSLAGQVGDGGILNVESGDELDAIMVGFPFGPFSEMEVYALADLKGSLQRAKVAAQAFAGGWTQRL